MDDVIFFFDEPAAIRRILVVGTLMYFALIVMVRFTGSRSLVSMDAFDFIITIAIGAVFGRSLTAKKVSLTEAVTAFFLLIALQMIVAWMQSRWPTFKRIINNPPILLYYQGRYFDKKMQKKGITKENLLTAVRQKEIGSMDNVEAIILETSGDFSIIPEIQKNPSLSEGLKKQIDDARFGNS